MADSGPHSAVPFGKYQLLKRVAVGGMAELYLAQDTENDRLVVIKRILPYLAQEADFVRMFLDEARIAAQLHHPSIITMYELGSLEGSIFIAMEYVEGVDLRKILQQEQKRNGVVPPNIAAWLTARLCDGLHYAHNRTDPSGKPMGIIHRDVSPQNLMVGYRGEVKLVDFGIAKASALMERSKPGVIKGKFLYLSPEQLSQERIDHRSDLFALGTMLYEVCVGKSPFFKPTTEAVIYAIRAEDPPPPHLARANFPQALSKVIMKCLQKDRARRYQQAAEVQKDLEAYLDKEAPTTRSQIEDYVAKLFGSEEERTVMVVPGDRIEKELEKDKDKDKKTAQARALRPSQQSMKRPVLDGEESMATAPEGRRPTPEPMKNPFEEEARTVLGLPPEETKPLGKARVDRTEATAQISRPPVDEEFLEPTAISKSGPILKRAPSGDSLPALTPALGGRPNNEPTGQIPPPGPKSSKVFEVPFEFARDEVPPAPPRPTRGANRDPPRQLDLPTEDGVGDPIDAGRQEVSPTPPLPPPKRAPKLGGSSDEDDLKSTAGYRRRDTDDVPSMVTMPSGVSNVGGGGTSRTAIFAVLGIFVLVGILATAVVFKNRGIDKQVPPIGKKKPDAGRPLPSGSGGGAGASMTGAGGGAGGSTQSALADAGAAGGGAGGSGGAAGGGGNSGAAGGGGTTASTDGTGGGGGSGGGGSGGNGGSTVLYARVTISAPAGTRITVGKSVYKPPMSFAPGTYKISYVCPGKKKKTRVATMVIAKGQKTLSQKLSCK